MAILQWNIRGLKPNYAELCLLLDECKPSVVCLQETKLSEDSNKTIPKTYYSYHHINTVNQIACGGTSILIKKSICPHRKITVSTNLQALAVRLELHKPVTICSVYIPPSYNLTHHDLPFLLSQLPSPVLLLGDFNAHSPLWSDDISVPDTRGLVVESLLTNSNIVLLNTKSPTYRCSSTFKSSSIDLSLCDPSLTMEFEWKTLNDLHGSDHYPITLSLKTPSANIHPEKWNFKRANWDAFCLDCKNQLGKNANISNFDEFLNTLLNIAEKHIPKTSTKPRKNLCWFTEECKQAVRNKRQAYRKLVNNVSPENIVSFKIARAKARRIIRQSKRECFQRYVSKINSSTPMNKVWKMLNKLRGTHKDPTPSVKDPITGSFTETPFSTANCIAETFSKNSSSLNFRPIFQKHKSTIEKQPLDFRSDNTENYNAPFSLKELEVAITNTNNTAPGPDLISYEIIKHIPPDPLNTLLHIFNSIWTNQTFPNSWRRAKIIPIQKLNKDHSNPSNYRPIALTSCFGKILEKMVNKRLLWVLETQNFLSKFQSGFRKNRSTTDHLVKLESFIRRAFSNGEHVIALFFDLEKAFDTTWKRGILEDFHDLGLRGHMPKFIENFLRDRHFQVQVGSSLSDSFDQEEGVPQGSVLSPILFEIKINSIISVLKNNIDPSLYVDDFLICYKTKAGAGIAERQLQLQLKKLEEWADRNGFKFSPSKTEVVHFCKRHTCVREPDLFLYGERIPVRDQAKFLGLVFDRKLTFLPHVRYLRSRCQRSLGLLRVLANKEWGADTQTLLHLYRTLIRSRLDYGCFVYGSARKSVLRMLDPVHHQGVRTALGAFRTSPIDSMLVEANEPPLRLRRLKLALQYAAKLASIPDNPTYCHIFGVTETEKLKFSKSKQLIPPLGIRLLNSLQQCNISPEFITQFRLPSTPPWLLRPLEVDLNLASHKKVDTGNKTYIKLTNRILETYKNYNHIYTDGSKTDDAVGSAAYSSTLKILRSERLNNLSSVFTAECHAIHMALDIASKSTKHKFLILSDSLSCLTALTSSGIDDPRTLSIIEKHNEVYRAGKRVTFVWIPGHVGIEGNEEADRCAKNSLNLGTEIGHPVPHTDFKPTIQRHISELWSYHWDGQIYNKLREIKPRLAPRVDCRLCRRDEVIYNRIKIGHTLLSHGHLLTGTDPPFCTDCSQIITVKHLLSECKKYKNIRRRYYSCKGLKGIFDSVSPDRVLSYLKEIGLFKSL